MLDPSGIIPRHPILHLQNKDGESQNADIAQLLFGQALTLGSLWPGVSNWLNGLFLGSDWLLWLMLVGSCLVLLVHIAQLLFLEFAEYHARHRPGWGDSVVSQAREKFRAKYPKIRSRLLGATTAAIGSVVSAILFWAVLFFSTQALYGNAVQWESSAVALSLRAAAAFTFEEALGWALRGEEPIGIRTWLESGFTLPSGLTGLGKAMKLAAFIITPVSVSASVARIWRWSTPEKS